MADKLPLVLTRISNTARDLRAGCYVCHGDRPRWTGANAQALAAKHHDRSGHATWCDIVLQVRYGRPQADDRQIDIEDAIASASSGGAPECAPLPVLAAPVDRPVETLRFNARAARGRKPETAS